DRVVAGAGEDRVTAVAAEEHVGRVGPGDVVVAGPAVGPGGDVRRDVLQDDLVPAGGAVDLDRVDRPVDPDPSARHLRGLVQAEGLLLDRAGVRPGGDLHDGEVGGPQVVDRDVVPP